MLTTQLRNTQKPSTEININWKLKQTKKTNYYEKTHHLSTQPFVEYEVRLKPRNQIEIENS